MGKPDFESLQKQLDEIKQKLDALRPQPVQIQLVPQPAPPCTKQHWPTCPHWASPYQVTPYYDPYRIWYSGAGTAPSFTWTTSIADHPLAQQNTRMSFAGGLADG